MATLTTTSFLPLHSYYHSHTKPRCFRVGFFSLLGRQRTGYIVPHAIRSPKIDVKPLKFDEDDNGGRNYRRKSDRQLKQQRWWSDDDELEVEEEEGVDTEVWGGILEQAVDSLWILRLQEWLVRISKPHQRRKRRSKYTRKTVDDQDQSVEGKRTKKRDYSDSDNRVNVNNFGGWDDLVGDSREIGRLETLMEKQRLSRSVKDRDLPMLLRLLIAVFPPLASWTKLM
ncbi:uncharacterized protein [Spinacia oleracea]|uniref:Uncharacterized protein isoform X2 n=1 Tax=Spinacia oleracea TaxID=3562 RepID=A0A9R0HYW5_SPIOL|nr:uncharacterized protein LOC110779290 isoform X2 [Spinacia oleracea]